MSCEPPIMVSLTSLANRSTNGEPSERAGCPGSPTAVYGAPSEVPWLPTNHPNSVTAQGTLLHTRDKPYTTGLTTCSVQRVSGGYTQKYGSPPLYHPPSRPRLTLVDGARMVSHQIGLMLGGGGGGRPESPKIPILILGLIGGVQSCPRSNLTIR